MQNPARYQSYAPLLRVLICKDCGGVVGLDDAPFPLAEANEGVALWCDLDQEFGDGQVFFVYHRFCAEERLRRAFSDRSCRVAHSINVEVGTVYASPDYAPPPMKLLSPPDSEGSRGR